MRILLLLIGLIGAVFATDFKLKYWEKNLTFFEYLTKNGIDSTKFYNKIDPNDIKFLSAIMSDAPYFENRKNGKLNEALIPLGEEMQIHLFKQNKEYKFDIIPISYKLIKDSFSIKVENSCYSDLKATTNNPHIATYLKDIFKEYVDFTKLKKGDIISIDYEQKSIDGIAWGEPKIKSAYIQSQHKEYFALLHNNKYKIWTNSLDNTKVETKKIVKTNYKRFFYPLDQVTVTSKFTYKRWHPILHRYRPHLGIDYRGRVGTPIYAIADGKVIYAGWMRGYGKVVKIAHGSGVVSLYAHQSKILVKNGQKVKAKEVIGKVGSTGRSTGPHLHLGVYKNGKPINPNSYLNKTIALSSSIIYQKVIKNLTNLQKELPKNEKKVYNTLKNLSTTNHKPYKWQNRDKIINLVIKKESKESNDTRIKLSSGKGAT